MKQIGIVSRIHGINYGANLQALALQEALQNLGYNCTYINYIVPVPIKGIKRKILSLGYGVVRRFLGYNKRLVNTRKFNKNLNLTSPIRGKDKLYDELKSYDILMSGSDQIWNPRYHATSDGLYLFEHISGITKVSYASSFGVTYLDIKYKDIVKKALSDYKYISCREVSGVKLLKDLNLTAQRHIDPTFLLSASQWKRFFDEVPIINGKYICCYVMSGADKLNSFIVSCAEKIVRMSSSIDRIVILGEKEYKGLFSSHKYYRVAGPSEFLNIMYNADRILTSSFHGTCFSIIFNKPFNSILDQSNKFNTRIYDLLDLFGLQGQIIYLDEDIISIDGQHIDYQPVNSMIVKEQRTAYSYLESIID